MRPLLLPLLAAAALGCSRESPPGAKEVQARRSIVASPVASTSPPPAGSSATVAPDAGVDAAPSAADEGAPLAIFAVQGNIYAAPIGAKEGRIGYVRRGGKVQALRAPVKGKGCDDGWYKLIPYGYVCARVATFDLDDPQVRAGLRDPSLDDLLPYKYGHNLTHGTPLYRVVPSVEEMAELEPYLKLPRRERDTTASVETPRKKGKKRRRGAATDADAGTPEKSLERPEPLPVTEQADAGAPLPRPEAPAPSPDAGALDAGVVDLADAGADAGEDESQKPWWQRKYAAGEKPDIKLDDLLADANKTLAKRMVKGFYVAIDRSFTQNGRLWHRTTSGLIAPADRLGIVAPPKFHGVEIDEAHAAMSAVFVTSKSITLYEWDEAKKQLKPAGGAARYDRFFSTGKTREASGRTFRELEDGKLVRASDVAWTEPGPRPAAVKDGERWIDVNLARQTLVAFEGSRPIFATLVSTGRKGKDKAHDHTTPTGAWRVREKHVAATMDGDGAAAGDLPYSIEDVPYVMYFHESYALHGAFWHDSFGRQMSHGCINLAPGDAKRLFFWSDPQPPKGWFGMYSSAELPGSLVVVHD
ncbi:MAG: L,D-transpeptidase [Polyangiaceae bacterium]|nr:L,D-transpeptidase [Polyangiaceae bacterium]